MLILLPYEFLKTTSWFSICFLSPIFLEHFCTLKCPSREVCFHASALQSEASHNSFPVKLASFQILLARIMLLFSTQLLIVIQCINAELNPMWRMESHFWKLNALWHLVRPDNEDELTGCRMVSVSAKMNVNLQCCQGKGIS